MSDSAPSPSSDSSPPSPPTPADKDSPPQASESSPPLDSPSSPPPSSPPSNPSSPPSNSTTPDPLPPKSSPDAPPLGNSSSPPPPSDSKSSPPSPPSDSPPSSSASPPQPSVSSPDEPSSPPSDSPPSSENSPPVVSVPAPAASRTPSSPSPPSTGFNEPLPPVQTASPPLSETTPGANPSPTSPSSKPKTPKVNPTPPIETTPSTPAESTPAASHNIPRLAPPSHSGSHSSSQKSSRNSSHSSGDSDNGGIIGVTLAGALIIAVIAVVFVCARKRKKKPATNYTGNYRPSENSFSVKSDGYYYRQAGIGNSDSVRSDSYYASRPFPAGNGMGSQRGHGYQSMESGPMGNSKSWFTYEEMMEITNGFSSENILGEGGFGCVYKGWLQDGREVAVKQLKAGSGQGEREFRAEVEIISRVHHRHLVSLVGYCISENQRLLVYEFVPNSTLEHHLYGNGPTVMDWAKRVKIAIGSAKGLAYLHEDCHPRIIHRDIKSANILLDSSFEAQVADFGLAKLSNDTNTHVSTRVMGTFGYLAPEYAASGKLTDRSDVFSFGVVLLELVTGRKPVDSSRPLGEESLVEWARPLLMRAFETGDISELVDPKLKNNYVEGEMFRMIETAAACVRHSALKRPRMAQVVRALDVEGDMPDLTNGVKLGQSAIFESGQQSMDMQRFRRMAFGSEEFSSEYGPSGEFDRKSAAYSGEYRHSRESPHRPMNSMKSREHYSNYPSSGESETRAMNQWGSNRNSDDFHAGMGSRHYSGRSPL